MPVVPFIPAVIGAGATLYASSQANKANKQAINAQQQGDAAAIAEQRRQYDQSRADQMPWLQTGQSALARLGSMYGLQTPAVGGGGQAPQQQSPNLSNVDWEAYVRGNPDAYHNWVSDVQKQGRFGSIADFGRFHYQDDGARRDLTSYGAILPQTAQQHIEAQNQPSETRPDYSEFYKSPDYQFRLDEGIKGLNARQSALGMQDSGAAMKAAIDYSGNLASGEYNNYANRIAALAGVGQTTATNLASQGQNFASNVGGIYQNQGNNLASSYQNQAANNISTIGSLAGLASGVIGQYGQGWGQNRLSSLQGLY